MSKKWSKEQRAKFKATMKAKYAVSPISSKQVKQAKQEKQKQKRTSVVITANPAVLFDLLKNMPKDSKIDISFTEDDK